MKYDSIINLPHYELRYHKRMSIENRAAQFAPYAALTGYGEDVKEASRLTSQKRVLSEDQKEIINMKLQLIMDHIKSSPSVTILYFSKDKLEAGGKYIEYSGSIKKIDLVNKIIQFKDNKEISIDDILDINSDFIGDDMYYN